jgi:hypothetical protein
MLFRVVALPIRLDALPYNVSSDMAAPPPLLHSTPEPQNQEPMPNVNSLADAWTIAFANLTVFLPITAVMLLVLLLFVGGMVVWVIAQGMPTPEGYTLSQWLTLRGSTIGLTGLIVMPVTTGLYGVAFRVLQGVAPAGQGFNAAIKHYAPSLMFGLMTSTLATVIEFAFRGLSPTLGSIISSIVGMAITIPTMLAMPAVVKNDWPLGRALQYSIGRVLHAPIAYAGYYIGASIMGAIGVIGCGIGVIFTLPISFLAIALLFPGVQPAPHAGEYPRAPDHLI